MAMSRGGLCGSSFLKLLEQRPELARDYCLSVYPVCNPTGFEDARGTQLAVFIREERRSLKAARRRLPAGLCGR